MSPAVAEAPRAASWWLIVGETGSMPKQLTRMVKPWLLPNKGAGGAFLPHARPLTAEAGRPALSPPLETGEPLQMFQT